MSADELSIEELETLTGVPRRNIRFLISEGVVPEPHGQRRWARYGPDHIHALRIYSSMKKSGVTSLEVIKDAIASSDDTIVVEVLKGLKIEIARRVIRKYDPDELLKKIADAVQREIAKKRKTRCR